MEEIKEKVRSFIEDNFLFGDSKVSKHQDLFQAGVIDSFGFVELLSFIEAEFGVSFDRTDIEIEKFNTLDKIAQSIQGAQRK